MIHAVLSVEEGKLPLTVNFANHTFTLLSQKTPFHRNHSKWAHVLTDVVVGIKTAHTFGDLYQFNVNWALYYQPDTEATVIVTTVVDKTSQSAFTKRIAEAYDDYITRKLTKLNLKPN